MKNILTKENALDMAKGMNLTNWILLQDLKHCFICKKFKKPLYIDNPEIKDAKILNGEYLFHLYSTHSLSPMVVVNMVADKIYNNEKDKEKMREFYKGYDKY